MPRGPVCVLHAMRNGLLTVNFSLPGLFIFPGVVFDWGFQEEQNKVLR
jgi:hypothetical protein